MADQSFSPAPRFLCTVAAIVLCAMSLPGQQNQQTPNQDAKPARIEGIVVSSTGQAVPRAEVWITPITPQGSVTGKARYTTTGRDDGTFVIDNIAAPLSNLSLQARRPGYSVARFGAADPKAPVALFSLAAGQVRKDMVLTMLPQGVVSGTVTSEEGDPIQNAFVSVLGYDYANGQKRFHAESFVQTNDLGQYRAAELSPGRYFLMATMRPDPGKHEVWLNTFYPNTTDALAAAPVQVIGGQDLPGMDIELQRGQGYTLTGKIEGIPPGREVDIMCLPEAWLKGGLSATSAKIPAAQVHPDGTFEVQGVLPGLHELQAMLRDAPPQHAGTLSVTVSDHDVSDLVFPLTDGVTVTGSVRFEEDNAPDVGGLRVRLGWAKGNSMVVSPSGSVEADGTFTIEHLPAGEYYLRKPTLPDTYIKAVRVNGTNVTGQTLNLNSSGTLDLVLGQDASRVTGVVRNGKGEPQAGMMVFLSPEKPNDSIIYRGVEVISTDIDGAFRFEAVPPGTYYAVAIEPLGNLPFVAREFPELFRARSSKVEVGAGGASPSVDLEVIPTTEGVKIAERAP